MPPANSDKQSSRTAATLLGTFFKSNVFGSDISVLRIEGEVDQSLPSRLSGQIDALLEGERPPNLVVDLGPVASVDYPLLDLLSQTARLLATSDRILVLITDHPAVHRILMMRGFDHVFPVEEPLPELLAEAGQGG